MDKKTIYILLIIAIMLSIASVVISFIRIEPITWDIVSILSFLVTILIGWQIYTIINVKKELDSLHSFKTEIEKSSKEIKEDVVRMQGEILNVIQEKIHDTRNNINEEWMRNVSFLSGYVLISSKNDAVGLVRFLFNQYFINQGKGGMVEELPYSLLATMMKAKDIKFEALVGLIKEVPFNEKEAFIHRVINSPSEPNELKELIKKLLKETL